MAPDRAVEIARVSMQLAAEVDVDAPPVVDEPVQAPVASTPASTALARTGRRAALSALPRRIRMV